MSKIEKAYQVIGWPKQIRKEFISYDNICDGVLLSNKETAIKVAVKCFHLTQWRNIRSPEIREINNPTLRTVEFYDNVYKDY